jgi:hypothetical protein
MKVRELQELLAGQDPEAEVYGFLGSGTSSKPGACYVLFNVVCVDAAWTARSINSRASSHHLSTIESEHRVAAIELQVV